MNDRERIEAMHAENRLTREQADELLRALAELGEEETRPEETAGTPDPAAAQAAHAPNQASGLNWLDIDMLAGDITVKVDPQLKEPRSTGDGTLQPSPSGMLIRQWKRNSGRGFLDSILDSAQKAQVEVSIPADWGVRLDVKAGDMEFKGPLRQLTGRVQAGNITAEEIHAIDLDLSAGDFAAGLLLASGQHRISCSAGRSKIELLPGTSATVNGKVTIGNIKADPPFSTESRNLGATLSGAAGGGAATLELRVVTGDLLVKAPHE